MKSEKVKQFLWAAIIFGVLSVGTMTAASQTRGNFRPGQTMIVVTARLKGYNDQRTYIVRIKNRRSSALEAVGSNYIAECTNLGRFHLPVSLN